MEHLIELNQQFEREWNNRRITDHGRSAQLDRLAMLHIVKRLNDRINVSGSISFKRLIFGLNVTFILYYHDRKFREGKRREREEAIIDESARIARACGADPLLVYRQFRQLMEDYL